MGTEWHPNEEPSGWPGGTWQVREEHIMRIRKAVISVALSAAAIGGMAAAALASPAATATPATTAAGTPFVGHNVGGGLLTRDSLHVGQVVNLVGANGGRVTNYRVTSAHRDGESFYVTVQPRLQTGNSNLVLFMTSN
jgi:hypothetical protein